MGDRPFIALRRENKGRWERRVALAPEHVRALVQEHDMGVLVQPAEQRVFGEDAYAAAGATITEDVSAANAVLGVKEIPIEQLVPGAAHIYFAHVFKGQPYNMPMLQALLDKGCHLIDYEKIADDAGRRLVFFGRYAGLAGILETLWALGQRLADRGLETPFSQVKRPHEYNDVAEARAHLQEIGEELRRCGVPEALRPMTFAFTGYGNVSQGAQELFDLLPHAVLAPAQLAAGDFGDHDQAAVLFKTEFREEHMAEPATEGGSFELQEYYDHPERYRGIFARYLPRLSVLVHGAYWDERYPRVVSREDVQALFAQPAPRLEIIGDISCDIEGGVEITSKPATVDAPVFVYDPATAEVTDGFTGAGPAVMAVDNLPCELPADASRAFGEALVGFAPQLAKTDFSQPLEQLSLASELTRALIVHRGELTPEFAHLAQFLA
jgi:alpha-aminoadipic semialdehyde synthase